MKLIIDFYNNLLYKTSTNFFINLFFLKKNQQFSIKQLQYIHIFLNLKKKYKIKIFKFNYNFYTNFVILFLVINIFIQFIVVII